MCKSDHYSNACPNFKEMQVNQRSGFSKQKKFCMNGLRNGNFVGKCNSKKRCFTYHGKHHTQLHRGTINKDQDSSVKTDDATSLVDKQEEISAHTMSYSTSDLGKRSGIVLLGTALVHIHGPHGNLIIMRALIDPASEWSFVSEKIITSLLLQVQRVRVKVTGVGANFTIIVKKETTLSIKSAHDKKFSMQVSAHVLDKLTQILPRREVNASLWSHIRDLPLADPKFNKAQPVDCLLEADVYSTILLPGIFKGVPSTPVALLPRTLSLVGYSLEQPRMKFSLQKFWEMEEISLNRHLTDDEKFCGDHFSKTTTRNKQGRYDVRPPIKKTYFF
ncbi:uncharacterized protein LOC106644173 [Copidosoma floridanum]|uniref:uncharacterized protein LOC106644173 n=1 Tax=Copidosoma floridanum TaxID=29053 RepID=UPI0006C93C03|nr:uncharacterized protein LOC106644173 [Copidosoma floridanum]